MSSKKTYFKLCMGTLPDELYFEDIPVEKWLALAEESKGGGFPPNSINQLAPLETMVEMERIVGISLYMLGNVLPFVLVPLLLAAWLSSYGRYALMTLLCYFGVLFALNGFYFAPYFRRRYKRSELMGSNIKDNQYLYTERNTSKYLNTTVVWPDTLQQPKWKSRPLIFCLVPHGVAPLGATAYPMWSKIWSSKLCHWTAAPVVLSLPLIGFFMRKIGYIPAKAQNILETLTGKEESVGVFLDGIAGMFQGGKERAYVKQRKGIVKIALRAGVPIIPVYAFGHTAAYSVLVDPLGILEFLSNHLQASLTPFFGRWGWFLGPPHRVPVTLCLGEPIECPVTAEPTNDDINQYHAQMVAGFQQVFDQHKEAYGWGGKELTIV